MTILIEFLGKYYDFPLSEKILNIKEGIINTYNINDQYIRFNENDIIKEVIENPNKKHMNDVNFDFSCNGKFLSKKYDNMTLHDFLEKELNLKNNNTHIYFRIVYKGNYSGEDIYFDIESKNIITTDNPNFFNFLESEWAIPIKEGLNIFGICKNILCKAYKKEVLFKEVKIIDEKFDLKKNINTVKVKLIPKKRNFLFNFFEGILS